MEWPSTPNTMLQTVYDDVRSRNGFRKMGTLSHPWAQILILKDIFLDIKCHTLISPESVARN